LGKPKKKMSASEGNADQEPLLRINPLVLYFPPPLNRIITNILKLHNTSPTAWLAFKVKTTRPQRYCVRPNLGIVPPGDTVELQIHFSFHKDPPGSLKCKDKFQVESMILVPPPTPLSDLKLGDLFRSAAKESIMKQKLKCSFTSPTPTKTTSKGNRIKATEPVQPLLGVKPKLSTVPSTEAAHEGSLSEHNPDSLDEGSSLKNVVQERDDLKQQLKQLELQLERYHTGKPLILLGTN